MTYSKFIKTIKFVFLGISILMLLLIVINNRQNQINIADEKFSYTEKIDGSINQVLVKPIFMGLNKKEQPFELIIPSFSNWMCDSLTFNIISTYTYDLYCKTQRVIWPNPKVFSKFDVDEVDDKFWVFLSSLGIKVEVENE